MKHYRNMIVSLFLVMLGSGIQSQAVVVTDNNLSVTNLPNLVAPANTTVSHSNFATVTNRLVAVQSDVTWTPGGSPSNGYVIDRLTPGGGATTVFWAPTLPVSYSATHTLADVVSGTNSLSYDLNVGIGPPFPYKAYTFSATNIKFYQPAGADFGLISTNGHTFGGNLVPNASFENPNLVFFGGGGGDSIVADPGKQGAFVERKVGTVDSYITLPVVPGQQYAYSFWYKIVTDNYGQIEWGLNPLGFSTAIAAGNSGTGLAANAPWTQVTGLFTPLPGQNYFYIGGLANEFDVGQGTFFDSFYLAAELEPEPSTIGLLVTGGWLIWQRRRSARR